MSDGPAVGEKAPGIDLPGDGGTQIRLGDYSGRAVVIFFYPKDDTSGCTREAIDFTALLGDFHDAGAEVVGISADSVKKHDKFKEKHGLKVRLASDEEHAALEAYGVWVEKSMYGRKYMGIERSTYLIDGNGKVARVWRKVKVPNHAAEVLDAVKELS